MFDSTDLMLIGAGLLLAAFLLTVCFSVVWITIGWPLTALYWRIRNRRQALTTQDVEEEMIGLQFFAEQDAAVQRRIQFKGDIYRPAHAKDPHQFVKLSETL